MNKSPAIAVDALSVRRGSTQVFDGFSVEVASSRITGLLGPSGCGKTTLMRAIVGVQRIQGGRVVVLEQEAGTVGLRGRIGYSTQSAAVYDDLTVTQNLRYVARILGLGRGAVDEVLAAVDLEPQARQLVGSLSGGQRSRASLAMAMLGSPDLLVLDEPTVGLDPVLRDALWAIFRTLADRGATLLVSSHVMDEAVRCDDLLLLREGRLLAQTTPDGLLRDTGASDAEAAFLALVRRGEAEGGAAA